MPPAVYAAARSLRLSSFTSSRSSPYRRYRLVMGDSNTTFFAAARRRARPVNPAAPPASSPSPASPSPGVAPPLAAAVAAAASSSCFLGTNFWGTLFTTGDSECDGIHCVDRGLRRTFAYLSMRALRARASFSRCRGDRYPW